MREALGLPDDPTGPEEIGLAAFCDTVCHAEYPHDVLALGGKIETAIIASGERVVTLNLSPLLDLLYDRQMVELAAQLCGLRKVKRGALTLWTNAEPGDPLGREITLTASDLEGF
ncbi:MAG: hypothetical protein VX874_11610 [Pseudomonadota bacterium]|nr:hypothetical protein [Pseudomonadota bacterium]